MLEVLIDDITGTEDDESLRAIILDAEGPVFSAGHNLKELVNRANIYNIYRLLIIILEAMQACSSRVLHAYMYSRYCHDQYLIHSCMMNTPSNTWPASSKTDILDVGLKQTTLS